MNELTPLAGRVTEAGYATPTGDACPRQLTSDGSLEGPGHCYGCGSCLLLEDAAWPDLEVGTSQRST